MRGVDNTMAQPAIRILLSALSMLLVGCETPQPTGRVSPQEQLTLGNRAIDLLVRAAESELDDASCNAIEALAEVAPQAGRPVFRAAIESNSPLKRYAGYIALGDVRDKARLARIKRGVQDPNPQVRLGAAYAAVRCGADGYARVLIRALSDASEERVRANAATLLGRLGEPRAADWLRRAQHLPANAQSSAVQLQINHALARLGDEDALQELIVASQGDMSTRMDALLMLARLGDPRARDALRYRLANRHEDYWAPRLIAARGLARLGENDGFEMALHLLDYTDTKQDPRVPDDTFAIRSMAIHALAEMGDPRALPKLRMIAAESTDPRLQVAASYAICRILDIGHASDPTSASAMRDDLTVRRRFP